MNSSKRSRIVAHLRAQWMGALALFLVIAGGTAYAANTIGSADIIDESIQSVDLKNGQVKSSDLANNQVQGVDVKDQSGVDTCTHGTARFGELCVGVANENHTWVDAGDLCTNLDLRLPSLGEARVLAHAFDIPVLGPADSFWTEERAPTQNGFDGAYIVNDVGTVANANVSSDLDTVCVTTPTN